MTADEAINRLNTHSAEVSKLYPHHGTHGLSLPFGWTNGIPTKPIYYQDTLLATPTNTAFGFGPGWPRAYQRHQRPPSWQNKNGPKRGERYTNHNNGHTRLMPSYLIRVAPTHNLPSLEAPARGMTIDPARTSHKGKRGCTDQLDMVAP